jgi:glycosyltransferase involved in cell wall biosynthesis
VSDRLSFCLISTFYPPANFGGDGIHVERLAHALAARGHRVRVLHNPTAHHLLGGNSQSTAEPSAAQSATSGKVEVVAVPSGATARQNTVATYLTGRPVGYADRLAELTGTADVIHFHNPSLLGGAGGFGSGGPDAIRLYTTHEHWLICPTHVLFRFDREVCTRRTCFRCTVAHRRPPQGWRSGGLLRRGVAGLDALLSPSRYTAELHRREFPGSRVNVLALPVPTGLAAERSPAPPRQRPFVLYAGRLERIKGVDRLIRAFASVVGADLVVAGGGSQREHLQRLAADDADVHLLGPLPHADVLSLAAHARAVVIPSAGLETFGGIGLEAMAVGTPIVVRNLGPLPELVENGGGLAAADDDGIAAALQRLIDDEGLARQLGEQARAVARDHYAEADFFRNYFRIIADVAARRGQTSTAARAQLAAESE